jgi:hypothetical protein
MPPFDTGKPFFPLVMNFAVQMLGFKEVMAMADLVTIRTMLRKIVRGARSTGRPAHLVALRPDCPTIRGMEPD